MYGNGYANTNAPCVSFFQFFFRLLQETLGSTKQMNVLQHVSCRFFCDITIEALRLENYTFHLWNTHHWKLHKLNNSAKNILLKINQRLQIHQ